MKDNEIVKALECCTTTGASCKDCPAFVKVDRSNCKKFFKGAIDLINRQKADLDMLSMDLSSAIMEKDELFDMVENQKAEIDELTKYKHDYYVLKAETAKEFASKLVKKLKDVKFTIGQTWEIEYALKRTLQEMTEGNGKCVRD